MPKLSKQQMWAYAIVIGLLIGILKWGGGTIYDNIIKGQDELKAKQEEILNLVGEVSGRLIRVETIIETDE